jgi:hypothetical protein
MNPIVFPTDRPSLPTDDPQDMLVGNASLKPSTAGITPPGDIRDPDQPTTPATGPLLPPPDTNRGDIRKVMASFDDLLILMSKMGKEVRLSERMTQLSAMVDQISAKLAAAAKKDEAADDLRKGAIMNLVMVVVSAAVTIVSSGIQLKSLAGAKVDATKGLGAQQDKINAEYKLQGPLTKEQTDAGQKPGDIKPGSEKAYRKEMRAAEAGYNNSLMSSNLEIQLQSGITGAVAQLIQSFGSTADSLMKAESQSKQASAERMQALAEQFSMAMQRSQSQEADFKEFMQKVNELIRDFHAAILKMSEAVSH